MGKNGPRKPKGAGSAQSGEPSSALKLAVVVAALAAGVGIGLGGMRMLQAGEAAAWDEEWGLAADRLGHPSPTEEQVAPSCAYIRPLFSVDGGETALDCTEFLRNHWETAPLLSKPGRAWNQAIMTLDDVGRMIGAWPIRFMKNHATVSMHKPNSGFLADTSKPRWARGEDVPTNAVEIAMQEDRTMVAHNLEVYWPPVGRLILNLVKYFHAYTQTNLYISPPFLQVATAPHQDAHSVFIVQTHGAKRWCVHAPLAPLTLKPLQRGKNGDIIAPTDRSLMGPPILNITLRPGRVLYIPRAFWHHTATDRASLAAPDVVNGEVVSSSDVDPDDPDPHGDFGQPSMALTLSILSEDVHASWMMLLGEALQELPPPGYDDAELVLKSLRRVCAVEPHVHGREEDAGSRLREALPRYIAAECVHSPRPFFTVPEEASWRRYATSLLAAAIHEDNRSKLGGPPAWLSNTEPTEPLFQAMDAVLYRKRIPCALKRQQIEAMQGEMRKRPQPLTGEPILDVDVDTIFRLEKQDKSYLPQDKTWFNPRSWS